MKRNAGHILRRVFSMLVFVFASVLFFGMFGAPSGNSPALGGSPYIAWAYIMSAYALIIVAYVRKLHPLFAGIGAFLTLFFYIATTSVIDLFPFGRMQAYETQYWLAMVIYSAVAAFLFYVSVAVMRHTAGREGR